MGKPEYAIFKGKGYLSRLVNGVPGEIVWTGDIEELEPQPATEFEERKENYSGKNAVADRYAKERTLAVKLVLRELTKYNSAVILGGELQTVAAETNIIDVLPVGLKAGSMAALENSDITNVVVKDSAATPATLTLNTHYTVDEDFGVITIKALPTSPAPTQPLKVTYDRAQREQVIVHGADDDMEFALFFFGQNTRGSKEKLRFEAYRLSIDPAALALIADTYTNFELNCAALVDATKEVDPEYGQYARLIHVGAV